MNPCGAIGSGAGGRCMELSTRLYPAGWRCAEHTPARMAGRPEPGRTAYTAPAVALRDRGVKLADDAADPQWKRQVDAAIAQLAATRQPFTADDVRAFGIPEPASHNAWGGRFLAAAKAGRIRRIGSQPSRRTSVHGHHVALWEGAA